MKPLLLLIGVAAAIAAGVGVMLWSVGPTYSLLYSNLAAEDTAQITQSLEGAGIPYKLENGVGTISVPAEQLAAARLQLAVARPAGRRWWRECHDEGSGLRRQRVHGERALPARARNRTRAHHRQPAERAGRARASRHGAAVRVRAASGGRGSASVFLQIKAGRRLDDENVQAIAISWLPAFRSSRPRRSPWSIRAAACCRRRRPTATPRCATRCSSSRTGSKKVIRNRIQEMLTPLVGPGRVRAQVVAQVDMTTTEYTREQYQSAEPGRAQRVRPPKKPRAMAPAMPVAYPARSPISRRRPAWRWRPDRRQPSRSPARRRRGREAGATPNNADGTAVTGPDSTSRQTTRNYEIDRTMAYTRAPAGRVTRLSVAVLIDNLRTTDEDGKVTETPLPADQLDRLTTLVRDAVGFDSARGDTVNVVNSSFLGTPAVEEGELESIPFWERAWAQTSRRCSPACSYCWSSCSACSSR